jgi:hypothetical protein
MSNLLYCSEVQQAMDMENHAMLSATVKAKIDAIADFYKSAIPGKGWKAAFQTEQEDMKIIQFQKDKTASYGDDPVRKGRGGGNI